MVCNAEDMNRYSSVFPDQSHRHQEPSAPAGNWTLPVDNWPVDRVIVASCMPDAVCLSSPSAGARIAGNRIIVHPSVEE